MLRTEKSTVYLPQRKYLFLVDKAANKIQIKQAVQDLYKVKVEDVNT
ncbi:MAG: 50S ribosomal protein L23, partial [Candidatus Omnitrophica bacterium]|nr:50S ribosomal protein L23 [Candidatus Omnitrophota bacterium]